MADNKLYMYYGPVHHNGVFLGRRYVKLRAKSHKQAYWRMIYVVSDGHPAGYSIVAPDILEIPKRKIKPFCKIHECCLTDGGYCPICEGEEDYY